MTPSGLLLLSAVAAFTVCDSALAEHSPGLAGQPAPVDDGQRHRLMFGGGVAHSSYAAGYGFYTDKEGATKSAVHLGYAYRPVRGFELGGEVRLIGAVDVFLPSLTVRGFGAVAGEHAELGLSARPGMMVLHVVTRGDQADTWVGPAIAFGPDLRVWPSRNIGVQLSADVTFGTGVGSHDPRGERSDSVFFSALGASLAIVLRL